MAGREPGVVQARRKAEGRLSDFSLGVPPDAVPVVVDEKFPIGLQPLVEEVEQSLPVHARIMMEERWGLQGRSLGLCPGRCRTQ